jgi:hypothetical protein
MKKLIKNIKRLFIRWFEKPYLEYMEPCTGCKNDWPNFEPLPAGTQAEEIVSSVNLCSCGRALFIEYGDKSKVLFKLSSPYDFATATCGYRIFKGGNNAKS